MKYDQYKSFNLTTRRPRVLFLGNGLFYNDCNWDDFIEKCRKDTIDIIKWDAYKEDIPYSIRANIACDFDDTARRNKYAEQIKLLHTDNKIYDKKDTVLSQLLQLPFDAVLTSNYTYQIENYLDPKFVTKSADIILKNYVCTTKSTTKKSDHTFLLHTFNRVKGIDVWHVHGEARRKSSIILTHDEYGRLSSEIRNYFQNAKNRYETFCEDFRCETWMDYIIVGDVYILGYGADLSEFDFWWLLGRRAREKSQIGTITFYEPSKEKDLRKHFALKHSLVGVETLGFDFSKDCENYNEFYNAALADIKKNLT